MDASDTSSGVIKFLEWLRKNNIQVENGIELGCGKGRNVIGLALQGIKMTGIDFSEVAIKEAKRRAKDERVDKITNFVVHDATLKWPFDSNSFDIAIDCFATTDIETEKGRKFAAKEIKRALKRGGYLVVYTLSTDDEFHKEMIEKSPSKEKNAFYHPTTGKFEKTFEREELLNLYKGLKLIEEARVEKTTTFFGKEYYCKHHWMIFKKK